MSPSQATFPKSKHVAFLQVSQPNVLLDDCWAEANERVLIVGMRKGEQPELRRVVAQYAEKGSYVEEGCLGTNVSGKLKLLINNEPSRLRGFLQTLSDRGLISEHERARASHDLGLRSHHLHQTLEIGAGI